MKIKFEIGGEKRTGKLISINNSNEFPYKVYCKNPIELVNGIKEHIWFLNMQNINALIL